MSKQLVQTVYLRTSNSNTKLQVGSIDQRDYYKSFEKEADVEEEEGIFFTQEEYNKHIKEVIENTLKNGAESVEIHFDNSQNLSRDFEYAIESKRIWVPKNSILNTFEETYLKYKI